MNVEQNSPTIWEKLSGDEKTVAKILVNKYPATPYEMLIAAVSIKGITAEALNKCLRMLQNYGVLESSTYLDRLKEQIAKAPHVPLKVDFDALLSEEQRDAVQARVSLEKYDQNPSPYESWTKPSYYRLTAEFRNFVREKKLKGE